MGFHTATERNPWWQVELAALSHVAEIRIHNRHHRADRLRHFSILLSLDGQDWRKVFSKADSQVFGTSEDTAPFVVDLAEGRIARHVRLRLDGYNCLHFNELEVLGEILQPSATFQAVADEEALRSRRPEEVVPEDERVTIIQTSDPFVYADMLFCTSRTVRLFCEKHGFAYEAYLGIKRGYYPYQATFNRIYMIEELLTRGSTGWAVYMDADAYIADLDFNLAGFLADHVDKGFLATPSGASDEPWDVNAGVFLLNLSHPTGQSILAQWKAAYEAADDTMLRNCSTWHMGLDDQQMLHTILRDLPTLESDCGRLPWTLINSPEASFIRQHLRAMHDDMPSRLAAIERDVTAVMAAR